MRLIHYLEHAIANSSPLFTCEIVPPLKGHSIQDFWKEIEQLAALQPKAIDVTYHHQDLVETTNVSQPDQRIGTSPSNKIYHFERQRAGTIGICGRILHRFNIDPIPHIICTGFDYSSLEDLILDFYFLGIENLVVLQGDKRRNNLTLQTVLDGPQYASDLLQQIKHLVSGRYLYADLTLPDPPNFCIGVAGYPEKHPTALSAETDLTHLLNKIKLGADYIITQMFFDNQKYFNFVHCCRRLGITGPILPGLKPITTKKQLLTLPKTFSLSIPDELRREIQSAKNDSVVQQIGIDWCVAQCLELKKFGVPALHFYTMSKARPIVDIVQRVF